MAVKKFYLVGDSPSTSRDINVDPTLDLKALRATLVESFHIAGAQGLSWFLSYYLKLLILT